MPQPALVHCGGQINLQATLSASSAGASELTPAPHHPITCTANLFLFEDGRFACEHAEVPPDDERTRHCLNATAALLIMEMAYAAHL